MKCEKFVAMTLQRTLRAEIPPQARVCLADIFSWLCVSIHHNAVQQPLVWCLLMHGPWYICHGWKCVFLPHFHVKISSMSLAKTKQIYKVHCKCCFQQFGVESRKIVGMMIILYFILQGFFPQHPITTPPK